MVYLPTMSTRASRLHIAQLRTAPLFPRLAEMGGQPWPLSARSLWSGVTATPWCPQGETWSVNGYGERYQRWWGENHHGNTWVQRWGNSTTGATPTSAAVHDHLSRRGVPCKAAGRCACSITLHR